MSSPSSPEPPAHSTAAPDSTVPVVVPAGLDPVPEAAPTSALEDPPFRLTPGWVAVGVTAVGLGLVMGFIMSSVWIVR